MNLNVVDDSQSPCQAKWVLVCVRVFVCVLEGLVVVVVVGGGINNH